MHNTIHGSTGMAPDTPMAQSNGYGNDGWGNISPYSQSPYNNSPMNEYSSWGAYMPHGLPSESIGRMPPPTQSHSHQMIQPAPMGHHQLPMLNTTWPSQLTNPTPSGSYSAPPLSMPPVSSATPVETPRAPPPPAASATPAPAPPAPPPPSDKARKTLSTEQKRAMCQYFEDNPGTRQADIGAKFGVERSTVSKVLRHKDQYLKRETDAEHASVKRGKGKHPDFDRTLSNYVRRQQQSGFEVKDEEIMEHASLFARASGNQEGIVNNLTSSWLQKFKQKHGIGAGRLIRRASETNIPDSARMSTSSSRKKDKGPRLISPASPTMSPLSEGRSDEDLHTEGLGLDFNYRHNASHSSTSLTNDAVNSSFSSSAMSPTTYTFSPDANTGGFTVDQKLQIRSIEPDSHHREKRSNTFPSLNIDAVNQTNSTEPMTPRHLPSSTAPSSALDSPAHETHITPFALDTKITSPPILHRSSSNSSITARSTATPVAITSTSLDSSPVSPSPEDARRAANTLLNYIQCMSSNGQFDQSEYLTIVQLTKKLQVHQHQPSRPSIGGLSRIPEGDSEMNISTEVAMESG